MTHTSTEQERQAPIKMHPGDDLHLTVLMASHGLNFVTGKDREQLLAWGRDVWQAARRAPAVPVPQGWKLVPLDPTNGMVLSAAGICSDKIEQDSVKAAYYDMLAAAPQPPEATQDKNEPVAYLWQHTITGQTKALMRDDVLTAGPHWHLVGPLFLKTESEQAVPMAARKANQEVG